MTTKSQNWKRNSKITVRFQDEIADLLEELHQKQMGQHEASA